MFRWLWRLLCRLYAYCNLYLVTLSGEPLTTLSKERLTYVKNH